MDIFVVLFSVIIAVAVFCIFLIFPANGKKAKAFDKKYIAHRGLHGCGIKENTAEAFENAVKNGFGVELDIRLSKDGIPVVNHDATLKRVFGIDKNVSEMTEKELNEVGVPSFSKVLEILGSKVPLVAEIKGENFSTEVCEKTAEILDNYNGIYCVESFNPMHLRWFKKNRKNVIRGQLSTTFEDERNGKHTVRNFLLRNLLLNFLSRPHFISYEHKFFPLPVRINKLYGAHMVCWTVTSQNEADKASKHYSAFIFEGFIPKNSK